MNHDEAFSTLRKNRSDENVASAGQVFDGRRCARCNKAQGTERHPGRVNTWLCEPCLAAVRRIAARIREHWG